MQQIHLVRRVIVLGLVLVSSACAHRGGAAEAPAPSRANTEVRVNVTNHYSISVDIYALGSGIRQRLGSVAPGMASSFVLPEAMVANGRVELAADIGPNDNPVWSGEVRLSPGDQVDFDVATHPQSSTIRVRVQ